MEWENSQCMTFLQQFSPQLRWTRSDLTHCLDRTSASLAFNAPLWKGSLLKTSPGWAAGVPHEHTQVCLLTLPTIWGCFRLGAEGLLVTPLRPICVMLWVWAPKSTPGSYKRLGSSLSHLDVVLQTTQAPGCKCVAHLSILTKDTRVLYDCTEHWP